MSSFNFEVVYEHLAQFLLKEGLPPSGDVMPPMVAILILENGQVTKINPLPATRFFEDKIGKNLLGKAIRLMLNEMPPEACVVVMSEAWVKSMPKEDLRTRARTLTKSLEHDPVATEAIMINIYYGENMRSGFLPIGPGRKLEYLALRPEAATVGGRLSSNPNTTPEDVFAAHDAAQDALRKASAKEAR